MGYIPYGFGQKPNRTFIASRQIQPGKAISGIWQAADWRVPLIFFILFSTKKEGRHFCACLLLPFYAYELFTNYNERFVRQRGLTGLKIRLSRQGSGFAYLTNAHCLQKIRQLLYFQTSPGKWLFCCAIPSLQAKLFGLLFTAKSRLNKH